MKHSSIFPCFLLRRCADTESVIDGYGVLNKEESFDRRDSRAITLVHKYAASFTKHYETMDRLNHDVEEIMDRFNAILDFIHQQLQQRASELSHSIDFIEQFENILAVTTGLFQLNQNFF